MAVTIHEPFGNINQTISDIYGDQKIDVFTYGGNDTINLSAHNSLNQIHTWAGSGDDTTNMSFSNITGFAHGHHVRGGTGNDAFNFVNTSQVSGTVVGRIEDLEAGDVIRVDGTVIDLTDPASLPSNVRIVAFDADPSDSNTQAQPWLLINTSAGGQIFYALEGARYDQANNGSAGGGWQESHFVLGPNMPANLNALPDWGPLSYDVTYVPDGVSPQGGTVINDTDSGSSGQLSNINGTSSGDLISAGLNNDTVFALDGNDQVWGGSGNDTLDGGNGNDSLFGGTGNDYIKAGTGNDLLEGQNGNDTLIGWGGNDTLRGGFDNDYLDGGNHADSLFGDSGNDTIHGGSGSDYIDGGTWNDRIFGGNDNDTILGGSGQDTIFGGSGFDRIDGGAGNDVMQGDFNADTFVFTDNHANDVIVDFDANNDFEKLDFSGLSSINSFSQAIAASQQVGADVLIDTGSNSSITLEGVLLADLDAVDFIF